MTDNIRLSLCMIVKDEAKRIADCLQSARQLVDEIVVVDTGSTDDTPAICESLGARVLSYPWHDSFCDARNFGLAQAGGEWAMWLDADERLNPAEHTLIRQALDDPIFDVISLSIINYYGDNLEQVNVNHAHIMPQARLFRLGRGIRFAGDIHETVTLPPDYDTSRIKKLDASVHHYGYMEPIIREKAKHERNTSLLLKQVEQPDHNPWFDYHLAAEYYRVSSWQTALDYVNRSILGFLQNGSLPPSLLYKLKYDTLLRCGSIRSAWPGILRAIQLYPDYVDLHFYKGIILMHMDMAAEALAVFEHCLELGEQPTSYLRLKGLGSFYALHYIGRCLERLGRQAEAQLYYAKSGLEPEDIFSVVAAAADMPDSSSD
ncbi:glycosyltransferase [Paenibacillus thalictri]|uniref:Glycosyltransferase n=1 Tax=Paenibacillus thalictri TaxID=2527873 RepID=A0A4Q9DW59_9BACL|nr:glycosyltransferase [Paenibacillus thalictri]TBL80626.1 glycosyltransferase [Paenibacillus thalictri]